MRDHLGAVIEEDYTAHLQEEEIYVFSMNGLLCNMRILSLVNDCAMNYCGSKNEGQYSLTIGY